MYKFVFLSDPKPLAKSSQVHQRDCISQQAIHLYLIIVIAEHSTKDRSGKRPSDRLSFSEAAPALTEFMPLG